MSKSLRTKLAAMLLVGGTVMGLGAGPASADVSGAAGGWAHTDVTCRPYDHQIEISVDMRPDSDMYTQLNTFQVRFLRWDAGMKRWVLQTGFTSPQYYSGAAAPYLYAANLPTGYYQVQMYYSWQRPYTSDPGWRGETISRYIENGTTVYTRNTPQSTWTGYCKV